jgi:DNA-binding protein H-NS
MPEVDLSNFSFEELDKLRDAIDAEKIKRQQEDRERLLAEVRQAASRYGMSVNKFLKSSERRRRSAAPKYRNPDDPKEVWSGRGKQPKWVQDALASGRSLDDLAAN